MERCRFGVAYTWWAVLFPIGLNVLDILRLAKYNGDDPASTVLQVFYLQSLLLLIAGRILYVHYVIKPHFLEENIPSSRQRNHIQLIILCTLVQIITIPLTEQVNSWEKLLWACVSTLFSGGLVVQYRSEQKARKVASFSSAPHVCEQECTICPCLICLESVDSIVTLSCGHSIHYSCLLKWTEARQVERHNVSCPICRADVL